MRDNPRWYTAYFEPYYPVKNGQADISAGMRAGIQWYYDGIFGEHPFAPNQAAIDSDLLGKGNTFGSGHVAMALTHSWYTCCIDPKVIPSWDMGVVPSYDGKTTAKMHGDTFAIMAGVQAPDGGLQGLQLHAGRRLGRAVPDLRRPAGPQEPADGLL